MMASWQARLLTFCLRHRFKPRLAAADTITQIRTMLSTPTGFALPADVRVTQAELGGIRGEWVEPTTTAVERLMLYVHGGGFVACSPQTHRAITSAFAQQGFRVFVPDYGLAPELPFPAGLMDIIAAYKALHASTQQGGTVVLAGDSAGGGLALAALLMLRDTGQKLPAAVVLFSPFVNLFEQSGSRQTNEKSCALFTRSSLARCVELYLSRSDPRMCLASPILGNLKGLPPMLIHVAAEEIFLDDSTRLTYRAEEAGVQVRLGVWRGMPHAFQLFRHLIPEGRRSLLSACTFLKTANAGVI
jgi:acetyl esterase/lipase